MTHEPECWGDDKEMPCVCPIVRTVYRHGRIDAANAVEAELHSQDELNLEFNKRILAAARGELE